MAYNHSQASVSTEMHWLTG